MPLWSPDIGGFGKVQTTSRQGIGVGPGVRDFFEKKYLGFSSAQQQIFRQYFLPYKTLVQRRGGIESADDPRFIFVWSFSTWLSVLVRLVQNLDVSSSPGQNDCWFSTLSTDKNGYPKFPVRPKQWEIRNDANHNARNKVLKYEVSDTTTEPKMMI
jgi:hypothetical protein